MKNLKNIDLISINCVNPQESVKAMKYCQKYFQFGKSILFTHENISVENIEVQQIDKLTYKGYNNFILKLADYSDNDYVMIVQDDGHIINQNMWDDRFFKYDYIGAPWPKEESWIEKAPAWKRKYILKNRIGNGGFSLRSKKFLQFSKQFQNVNVKDSDAEDFFLCCYKYDEAISYGIKFAPVNVAIKFSYENPCIEYSGMPWNFHISFDRKKHLGWHGKQFLNTYDLLRVKEVPKKL